MFDKKYKQFPNGKVFYMIDRSTFEIRKTKIYGYQFDTIFEKIKNVQTRHD